MGAIQRRLRRLCGFPTTLDTRTSSERTGFRRSVEILPPSPCVIRRCNPTQEYSPLLVLCDFSLPSLASPLRCAFLPTTSSVVIHHSEKGGVRPAPTCSHAHAASVSSLLFSSAATRPPPVPTVSHCPLPLPLPLPPSARPLPLPPWPRPSSCPRCGLLAGPLEHSGLLICLIISSLALSRRSTYENGAGAGQGP